MKLQEGRIENWNDGKGFGFVVPKGGGERAFVHIKAFKAGSRRPVSGDVIAYELVRQGDGRYKAMYAMFAKNVNSLKLGANAFNNFSFSAAFTLVFCLGLMVSILAGRLPLMIAAWVIAMSAIAFIVYALDKSAAQNNRWRTQESTLHLLSLMGGWPGALFAQSKLRHKSSKTEFKRIYWLTVLLNVGGVIWLHTEHGASFINTLMQFTA